VSANGREGWKRVKFGEVVRQVKAKVDPATAGLERFVAGEHMETDDLRIRQWGDVGDGYLGPAFTMRFKPGQVLYGSRRTYLRKVAVADFEGICANTTFVLEPADPVKLLPEFLPFIMQTETFHEHSKRESKGSVNPYVNFSDLAWYEFALPPVEEQRRIAQLLRSLTAALDTFQSACEQTAAVERATVHAGIEGLTRSSPIRALESGCLRVTDGTHQSPNFTEAGVPFFLVKTISRGGIDWSQTKYVSPQTYAELTKRVKPARGHVLYTAVGATYGVAKLVDFDDAFVFQRHIAHVIPNPSVLLGDYIELFLNSPRGNRLSDQHAIGSAQPTVTLRSLSSFPLPFPSLREQSELIEHVAEMRYAKRALLARMRALRACRDAALGELAA
jgi:hypothetical protein